jgi:hypothetical protein
MWGSFGLLWHCATDEKSSFYHWLLAYLGRFGLMDED